MKPTPVAFLVDGLRIVVGILGARLRRQPPSLSFDAQVQPIRTPELLGKTERASLYDRE